MVTIISFFSTKSFQKVFTQGLLNLPLLMTTQEAYVDSVDQDQKAQNMQSDLSSTLYTFSLLDYY